MVSPSTIPCHEVAEKPCETNTPLNTCSHLPIRRKDGAFLSITEMRKQAVIDIAVHVAHIRQLLVLEAGI